MSLQQNKHKKCILFSFISLTHHSFIFILQFLSELKHQVRAFKSMSRTFHFRFHFDTFCFFRLAKSLNYLTLKCYNSCQNKNNRKAKDTSPPTPVTFKLQQELSNSMISA